jgi:molybdate transport system ATP-binding protein
VEGPVEGGLLARFGLGRGVSFRLDLDLVIPPGRTVALLGPNGAGKSTAVSALAGLLPIDTGRIILAGVLLDDPASGVFVPPESRRVGVVFQEYLLFPHLNIVENVAFGLRSRGVPKAEALTRGGDWLRRLDVSEFEKRKPGELSGGQAQRVALARALVTEPDLLLLDEPLSALDVTTRVELRRVLDRHLDEFEGPRLVITHDPAEAFLLADEVHVIEGGSVTQSGAPDDIRLRPRTAYAADLAGSNLLFGEAANGVVDIGAHQLHIPEHDVVGDVLLTIRPSAVSVHRSQPEGSPRNSWEPRDEIMERLGERTRLRTGSPLPLTIEITSEATADLGLDEGDPIWVAVKATEIGVESETVGEAGR